MQSTQIDFGQALAQLNPDALYVVFVTAAILLANLGFAVWAGRKVARFFG